MVIKTELCAFSDYRIYPGNGMLFVRRDGRPVTLGSSKAKSLMEQRKKPSKLVWTQAWRRSNKKSLTETVLKKRSRKVTKVQRAVVGASIDDIKKRATENKAFRSSAIDAAKKELKDQKKKEAKKAKKAGAPKAFQKSQNKAIRISKSGKR